MDKLIEDLNLTALEQNGKNFTKVSLSPIHSTSPLNLPLNYDFYIVDERLNCNLEKGKNYDTEWEIDKQTLVIHQPHVVRFTLQVFLY